MPSPVYFLQARCPAVPGLYVHLFSYPGEDDLSHVEVYTDYEQEPATLGYADVRDRDLAALVRRGGLAALDRVAELYLHPDVREVAEHVLAHAWELKEACFYRGYDWWDHERSEVARTLTCWTGVDVANERPDPETNLSGLTWIDNYDSGDPSWVYRTVVYNTTGLSWEQQAQLERGEGLAWTGRVEWRQTPDGTDSGWELELFWGPTHTDREWRSAAWVMTALGLDPVPYYWATRDESTLTPLD
jgi:hypothetical protein